jgi:alkaline phosphatase D
MKIFLSLLALGVSVHSGASGADLAKYSVLQGITDDTNVQFSIVYRAEWNLKFRVHVADRFFEPTSSKRSMRANSPYTSHLVAFSGLPAHSKGVLHIESSSGHLLEIRHFQLFDTTKSGLRMAFVSCSAGYLYRPIMWERLNASNPDLIFLLGDNVYADRPSIFEKKSADPDQLWTMYINARLTYDLYFRPQLIPTLATWDDHDFGANEADELYPFALDSLLTFKQMWPQEPKVSPLLSPGPGVASSFRAFGMTFVLLDDRYFRSPMSYAPETRSAWGREQREWLRDIYNKSQDPLWLINGQQFLGGYHGSENVESEYPADLAWLVELLRSSNRPVAFVGGDVHFSEVMDIEPELFGRRSVEITSSSMHSLTFPGHQLRYSNPRRRASTSWHNFVLVDAFVENGHVHGNAMSIGASGRPLFNESISF